MKSTQTINLLEKTTEVLSSNESTYYKQNTYPSNYKLGAKLHSNDNSNRNNNELKSQMDDSFPVGELDYYKEMITKMNSDIGDINTKLLSIDNSLTSSILSGNPESMRTIQEIAPNTDRMESFHAKSNNAPQYNQKKERREPLNKEFAQSDLEGKDRKIIELELNSKALLEKNKELEQQLSILDNIINEPVYTQNTKKTVTETNHEESNLTEQCQTKSNITIDNDNHEASAKTLPTPTANKNNYSNIKEDKGEIGKNLQDNKGIRLRKAKASHQRKKRSGSARNYKLKSITETEGVAKAKINDLAYMLNQKDSQLNNHHHQQQITFTPSKEQYYDSERKLYIEKLNYLESSFNNQIRALNQKYQSTLEKQDSKIKRLTKENETLKLKLNQIKSIMK